MQDDAGVHILPCFCNVPYYIAQHTDCIRFNFFCFGVQYVQCISNPQSIAIDEMVLGHFVLAFSVSRSFVSLIATVDGSRAFLNGALTSILTGIAEQCREADTCSLQDLWSFCCVCCMLLTW